MGRILEKKFGNCDGLEYFTGIFQTAVPIVYNCESSHPLKSKFHDIYGDTYFIIYEPLGKIAWNEKDNPSPFYLFIIYNEYTFEKYVDFFFLVKKCNREVKCFGKVGLLMLDNGKMQNFAKYHDAMAMAFKNGCPVFPKNRIATYLFHNDKLIETPEFFRWTDNIEKDFETGGN